MGMAVRKQRSIAVGNHRVDPSCGATRCRGCAFANDARKTGVAGDGKAVAADGFGQRARQAKAVEW